MLGDEHGREVDVHPVRFDERGDGHVTTEAGEPFTHPARAFAATGSVAGRQVSCLSADAQMVNHSDGGYTPGETDVHDMHLLHERLGRRYFPRTAESSAIDLHRGCTDLTGPTVASGATRSFDAKPRKR